MTPSAATAVPDVLWDWSAWRDLRGAGRDPVISAGPGVPDPVGSPGWITSARRAGHCGGLGQLGGVYHARMPYRDPHTAAPALWALRHRDGRDFEVAVTEVPGTVAERKTLEAVAITLYRIESGRSPAASFGRMPAGYRISSGLPGADPASADWMGWAWSPWIPVSRARRPAAGTGLYRVRSGHDGALVYLGQGIIALRLRAHAAKAAAAGHRQHPGFSGDLEASWTVLPGLPPVSLLEHENDLIAAHVLAKGGRLCAETGQPFWHACALAAHVAVAAQRGDFTTASGLIQVAERVASAHHFAAAEAVILIARAMTAAGQGEHERAFAQLARLHDPADSACHPVHGLWSLASLAEAAVMCGETGAARQILGTLRPDVRASRSPAGQMNLAYAQAVLAPENEIETRLREVIRSDMATWPIERNRLLLTYGTWLRRHQRARESRDYLRGARDGFERLGARPWAERAREELRASGERSNLPVADAWDDLSRRRCRSPLWPSRASPIERSVSGCTCSPS